MQKKEIKDRIVSSLTRSLMLHKVILFGSSAYGIPDKHSDIDLIVVTDDDSMPANYDENMKNYLRVSLAIRDIKREIPIDLIVYTKPMYDKFIRMGSMFSKEILHKGEVLYEKNY